MGSADDDAARQKAPKAGFGVSWSVVHSSSKTLRPIGRRGFGGASQETIDGHKLFQHARLEQADRLERIERPGGTCSDRDRITRTGRQAKGPSLALALCVPRRQRPVVR